MVVVVVVVCGMMACTNGLELIFGMELLGWDSSILDLLRLDF